ncbi:MAG: AI-2E family transporter [Chloroflexota bacterium]
MTDHLVTASPRWSKNTKLIITLILVVIAGAFIMRFHNLLGPVLFAFILAYLLHPVASFLDKKLLHSWRGSVSILYLVFIIILITLLTWGGLTLLQQIQSLITLVQNIITQLPELISNLSIQVFQIGPFQLDFTKIDLTSIGQEILSVVQPLLGQLGNLVSNLAGSAASTFGWLAFIIIISYFFLLESGGLRTDIIRLDIPGYNEDIRRIGSELSRIWNAFLRGQIIIFSMTVITYSILLPILGVRYAIGLAFLAGAANFLPYIGPAINWIALGLVTFFQVYKPFGLTPLLYTGLVILLALLVDQIYNNLIIPRIMSKALKVHPAAVLISAIIAANLIGLIGLLIAAPLLATMILVGKYTLRKMLDRDPWPKSEVEQEIETLPSIRQRFLTWWRSKITAASRKKQ